MSGKGGGNVARLYSLALLDPGADRSPPGAGCLYALVGIQGSGDAGIDHRLPGARMTWSLGMPLVLALHIALRAVARHALRSGLAMLGISELCRRGRHQLRRPSG